MNEARSVQQPPLKVCHIVATTEGGAWLFGQVRDLRDRFDYEVAVILNGDRGALVDRFRAAGIPVHVADFDFTIGDRFFDLHRQVMELVRLLRRERFDVIQTHLFHSMLIGRIAAWIADVPVRLSRAAGPFHLEAPTSRWMDRWTCWIDTTVIASCELIRTQYEELGVPRRRIAFINSAPDETRFDPSATAPAKLREEFGWPADTPLVGMVAYFYPELSHDGWTPPALRGRSVKAQDDLIRAAPLVLREFPRARILFVGSGWDEGGRAYLQRMKDMAAGMGLERHVVFLDFRSDIPAVLRAFDVAVQSSLSENLGGTTEALLMECPLVVTRVGGMIDNVVDGETGVVVNPSDPPSLAGGILRLLRDPAAARQYGAAGRRRVSGRVTLQRVGEALDALYRDQIRRHPRGYRPAVSAARRVAGSVLCMLIMLRYRRPFIAGSVRGTLAELRCTLFNPHMPRMWLYRGYAFVGRLPPLRFGIRRRARRVLRSLRTSGRD